jgi:hypothetical protein
MPVDNLSNRNNRPCPRCGSPSQAASFPFCSDRCRLIDLSAWLSEVYTIPAQEPDDEEPDVTH